MPRPSSLLLFSSLWSLRSLACVTLAMMRFLLLAVVVLAAAVEALSGPQAAALVTSRRLTAEKAVGPPPRYFTQDQDHFDGTNANTWQQVRCNTATLAYQMPRCFLPASHIHTRVCLSSSLSLFSRFSSFSFLSFSPLFSLSYSSFTPVYRTCLAYLVRPFHDPSTACRSDISSPVVVLCPPPVATIHSFFTVILLQKENPL